MIPNQILKDSRCQLVDHEQNEYIKVCLNQYCNNRRLCYICFEENNHQEHEKFQDAQIIRMTQFINVVEQNIKGKQQFLNEKDNQLIRIKKSFDDIKNLFKKFIQTLILQQDSLKLEIEQTSLIIQRLKQKQYNIDDVNNAVDLIQNRNCIQDDFEQYLLRIEQLQFNIQDQLVTKDQQQVSKQEIQQYQQFLNENEQNFNSWNETNIQQIDSQAQSLSQTMIDRFKLINNINQEIKCETIVDCAQQSPCGRLLAYAMGKKIVICQVKQNQFENYSKCQNENLILSLKFSSDSYLLYFSDQQGYIVGVQVNNNQERLRVQVQPCQIEQLFLINDIKFISLCYQKQQIRITKLDSPNYYDDSEYVESEQNDDSDHQSENDVESTHNSVNQTELLNSDDQEYEQEISCEYYQSNLIEFDHLGHLSIDFNETDNLLVYPYDNHVWIQSYDTQQNFKRWIDEYDYNQSLMFKFSQDGKQLACVQSNSLLLYQVIVNQVTLLLIKRISLISEIYNLVYNDYCLYCDHGDWMSVIKNQQVAISEDMKRYHKQRDYYFTQQYNSSQVVILRGSMIIVLNLESQV